ncbi:MAG: YggS family pyridoxal phosphate-dependent enzyme, partial [Candidatus Omnitrophica bacterium]|nr:YggS family pyridoxal phosphate-dependent enzyme [Candidatus Omnitrophota bacterium]
THVGESKVRQALIKYPQLTGVVKHMIGHLQTNKVKSALEVFDIIQSVDSYRLAQELDRQCSNLDRRIQILVQVNTAGEEQKFGSAPHETRDLLRQISDFKTMDVLGLMAMGPLTENKQEIRDCFKKTKDLYQEMSKDFIGIPNISMKFLSMGMSDDYEIALEEGANMLRIG